MKRRLVLSVLAVYCLLSLCPAFARIWTDSSGTHKVDAELVKLDGEVVHLKKTDGTIAKVPLNKLCEDDREFVRQQFAAKSDTASPKTDPQFKTGKRQPSLAQDILPEAVADPVMQQNRLKQRIISAVRDLDLGQPYAGSQHLSYHGDSISVDRRYELIYSLEFTTFKSPTKKKVYTASSSVLPSNGRGLQSGPFRSQVARPAA